MILKEYGSESSLRGTLGRRIESEILDLWAEDEMKK
jgi:hypothetical protein